MFIIKYTLRLPITDTVYKTTKREIVASNPAEMMIKYEKLKKYEGVYFSDIHVYAVFEVEEPTWVTLH